MKIKLNVRVNLAKSGKIFTVWARPHALLPGVEFYTGHGHSTREAIEDLFLNMPDEFRIDDEIIVKTNLNIADLMVILTKLELEGSISQTNGDKYISLL